VYELVPGVVSDDYLDGLYLQGSSQWDGFLHMRDPASGALFAGGSPEDLGIEAWAERGIAGRGVLLDLPRWARGAGRPWDWRSPITITADDLVACGSAERVEVKLGTFLLIRVGWEEGYRALDADGRVAMSREPDAYPGLESSRAMAAILWDWGVAAVGCDNPALEVKPRTVELEDSLHTLLLPRLGMPIAELLLLDELADACAASGRYEFFFTAAPLNVAGGVGSPANALAIL
jgi:kynurenine formamidase